jgi:hypothetical protein
MSVLEARARVAPPLHVAFARLLCSHHPPASTRMRVSAQPGPVHGCSGSAAGRPPGRRGGRRETDAGRTGTAMTGARPPRRARPAPAWTRPPRCPESATGPWQATWWHLTAAASLGDARARREGENAALPDRLARPVFSLFFLGWGPSDLFLPSFYTHALPHDPSLPTIQVPTTTRSTAARGQALIEQLPHQGQVGLRRPLDRQPLGAVPLEVLGTIRFPHLRHPPGGGGVDAGQAGQPGIPRHRAPDGRAGCGRRGRGRRRGGRPRRCCSTRLTARAAHRPWRRRRRRRCWPAQEGGRERVVRALVVRGQAAPPTTLQLGEDDLGRRKREQRAQGVRGDPLGRAPPKGVGGDVLLGGARGQEKWQARWCALAPGPWRHGRADGGGATGLGKGGVIRALTPSPARAGAACPPQARWHLLQGKVCRRSKRARDDERDAAKNE